MERIVWALLAGGVSLLISSQLEGDAGSSVFGALVAMIVFLLLTGKE